MRRIDYLLNAKDPIKVLVEEFDLALDCYECPYTNKFDGRNCDCREGLRKYLEEDIEVNESDSKVADIESIGQVLQSIHDIPPQIKINSDKIKEKANTKETLQETLDEVKETLQKTLDKVKEPVENEFMEEYKKIVTETMELCIKKNKDYGSSVEDTFEKFGNISYLVRITDKYNRICSLLQNGKAEVDDESCSDTIRDMGNYLFLWLASRNLKGNK